MTWLNPYAVDGATLRAAMLRVLAGAIIGEGEGVAAKGDCKVTASPTPDTNIRVGVGGLLMQNRYPQGEGQAYAAYNDEVDIVPTTATGGGARSDLVVLRINDPEFSGDEPAPGEEDIYPYAEVEIITGVPGNTRRAEDLNLGYPAVELARIDRPASTATVTSSHIVDLRRLALPRATEALNHISIDDSGTNPLNTTTYQNWPILAKMQVDIPKWAVRAKVTGFVEGLRLEDAFTGGLRVILEESGVATEQTQVNENAPNNALDRRSYNLGGEIPIPSNLRGTTVTFRVQGKAANSGVFGHLKTDAAASASLRVLLEEVPT